MASSPLPLLALAGAALYLMKGKATGSADSSAAPGEDTTPLRILGADCQPLPEAASDAEKQNYKIAVHSFIQKRVPELYQKYMAQGYLLGRINTPVLTDAMRARIESDGAQIKDGYILAGLDDPNEIYAALYDELVPPSCAMKMVWDAQLGTVENAIYPSPAASCLAALLRVETGLILASVTGDADFQLTAEQVAETSGNCTGLNFL